MYTRPRYFACLHSPSERRRRPHAAEHRRRPRVHLLALSFRPTPIDDPTSSVLFLSTHALKRPRLPSARSAPILSMYTRVPSTPPRLREDPDTRALPNPVPSLPRAFSIFSSTVTGRVFPSRFPAPAPPSRAWTAHSPKHLPCPHTAGRPSTRPPVHRKPPQLCPLRCNLYSFPFSHSQVATLPFQRTGSAPKPTKPRRDPDAARSLPFPLAQPELELPEPKLHGQDKVVPFASLREPHRARRPVDKFRPPLGPSPLRSI